MTLREVIDNTKNWFVDSYNDTTSWFSDWFEKLINGNILDLTIGQALFSMLLVWFFIIGIKDSMRDFKSSGDDDTES